MRFQWFRIFILLPGFFLLFLVWFCFGPDIKTPPFITALFYNAEFIYSYSYLIISICALFIWSRKKKHPLIQKQTLSIAVPATISIFLNFIFETFFPILGYRRILNLGQIFAIITFLGIYLSITRFQFLSIPTPTLTSKLFHELAGIHFLLDAQGNIMDANNQVYELFSINHQKIVGKSITDFIKHDFLIHLLNHTQELKETQYIEEIYLLMPSGDVTPFYISIIPLWFQETNLLHGILITGEDISSKKWLQFEIERHKNTNLKLKNSELLFQKIIEITPVSILLFSKDSGNILYFNEQTSRLFKRDKNLLPNLPIWHFLAKEFRSAYFSDDFYEKKDVIAFNATLNRSDKSSFSALITSIPCVYKDQTAALCCIVDMTEQKKTENELVENNIRIQALNNQLSRLNDDLYIKSVHDGLTGLYNHQYINDILEQQIHYAIEHHTIFHLMMLDIDYFKQVNDTYGHMIGDIVLKTVSEIIQSSISSSSFAGRYGGEEFTIILLGEDSQNALKIANHIQSFIRSYDFHITDLSVTISAGIVAYHDESADELINKADILLYKAKDSGRDRIES